MRHPGGRKRDRRGPARGSFLLALLAAVPAPIAAQVAGRWLVVVETGATGPVRGELRLVDDGRRLAGTLWLETRDAGPQTLTGARAGPGGTLEFTADAPSPARFIGHLDGDGLRGDLRGEGPPRSWSAVRLPETSEYYPALPRFVVRAVISGRPDSVVRLPGPWLAAAAGDASADLPGAYWRAAAVAGVRALTGDTLAHAAALRAMGVLDRPELVAASVRTLESIRAGLADARLRARFDQLFRPRGEWQVDLHDVAFARARARLRTLGLPDVAPALRAAGWLPREGTPDAGTTVLALYRLFALRMGDSAAAEHVIGRMRTDEPTSAQAVTVLLDGYASATGWYVDAMRFFLDEPWVPGPPPHSLGDLVRTAWGDSAATPGIEARVFGYPQAVPRYGVPDALFVRLVHPDNWAADEWLRRHGRGGFLSVLHRLRVDYGPTATIVLRDETFRLASPGALAGEDANGFLEPRDAIVIDPGYLPLLAVGAIVHEWQHLLFQRRLFDRMPPDRAGPIVLPGLDPYLAEGLAEWRAERILAPVAARFPVLAVAEAEKRARLGRTRPNDPHVLGYTMVSALARVVPDEARMVRLLLGAGADRRGSSAVMEDPEVARAWAGHGATASRAVPAPSRRALVPEFTFTIEAEFPDLVATRILLP